MLKTTIIGKEGAYVFCSRCQVRTDLNNIHETRYSEEKGLTSPMTMESIAKGISAAIKTWNRRENDG